MAAALRRQDLVGVVLRRRRCRSSARRPRSTRAPDRLIEAADWVVWQLTGVETRNSCTAGYKAIWSKARRLPVATTTSRRSTRASRTSSTRRCRATIAPIGGRAGGLCERAAALDGPAARDAGRGRERRRARVRAGRRLSPSPGELVADHGHEQLPHPPRRPARLGRGHVRRRRGRRPAGPLRLRGRPVGRRRHLRLVRRELPCRPGTTSSRGGAARTCTPSSRRRRRRSRPGESGLLALDWWNGNRSVLVDADLSGLLVGLTLATRPRRDLPRADRGDRVRHASDRRRLRGARAWRVDRIVACGGLPERNQLLMQIYADVPGRRSASPHRRTRPRSARRCSAAVAGGAYGSIGDASERMARLPPETYLPDDRSRHGV